MATNQPLPDREPPPAAGEAASQQLASALRRNRLTLLCGEPGAGKSALLAKGVLPQLRRRGGDAAVSVARRPLEAVLPFPERRARDDTAPAELAVFVNDWRANSQASLHDGIDAALRVCGIDPEWHREPLTERVQSLSSRFGTRFLFVLDGFETVLDTPADGDKLAARDELLGEIVHLLNTPVPANLLIALRADAEVRLAPLLERLHAVRPEVLMLEGGRTRRVYGPVKAAAAPTAPPAPKESPPASSAKPKPTQLSQFDSARMPEAANTGAPTRPGDIGRSAGAPIPPAAPARRARPTLMGPAEPALAAPPQPPRRGALTKRRLVAIASIALAALAGGVLLFRAALPGESDAPLRAAAPAATIAAALPAAPAVPVPTPVPEPAVTPAAPVEAQPAPAAAVQPPPVAAVATPPATVATTPPAAAVPTPVPPAPAPAAALPAVPPRPSFALRVDADNAATRLPRELAQALAAGGPADLQIVPTPLALPAAGGRAGSPGLAIVRYDALQAAARGTTKPELAVVAPLYTEELQIVVRADSKLQFIHQIEGKRVNVGAAQGARALTARALYRQMFDKPLPSSPQAQLDAAPALQRLIAGDGIDAVVLVGPQPAAALAALPPAQRRELKLLALAPDNAASRRALQSYLPATLRDPAGAATPTLAAMSFLVTTGTPDAATTQALGRLASSLCNRLPELQRDGDAKWRELRAGLQLETGLPPAGAADAAWRACAGAPSASTLTSTRN